MVVSELELLRRKFELDQEELKDEKRERANQKYTGI